MIFAWIDPRPFLFIGLLPLVALAAWLSARYVFKGSSRLLCYLSTSMAYIAIYQFVLYGPFVDQKIVVSTPAKAVFSADLKPERVAFIFPESFGFQGILSDDSDVIKYIRSSGKKDVTVSVQLTYDFGKPRGMNLAFAYVDGILFAPNTEK